MFGLTVPKRFAGEPFSVSLISCIENFWFKSVMSRFSAEFFCLKVSKKIVGEPFCVSETFRFRKYLWISEGEWNEGLSAFFVKNCCLTLPKNSVEEPFCVSEDLWCRKN